MTRGVITAALRPLNPFVQLAAGLLQQVGGDYERGRAMKKARAILFTLLLVALMVHVLWIAIAPMVPYLVSAFVVVLALGFIYYRMTKW